MQQLRKSFRLYPQICLPLSRWLLCAALISCPTFIQAQKDLTQAHSGDLTKFVIPERNSDGALIWQLMGEKAKMRPDGKMEISTLQLETYRNNVVDWSLKTPECVLDRVTKEAVSESDVQITNKDTNISGKGFHWLAAENRFIIRTNSEVLIPRGISSRVGGEAKKESSKGATTIRSTTLNYDYDKRIAILEGNVIALDPELKLMCDSMTVYFDKANNEVLRVETTGAVHLYHEDKEAMGDKASFTRETGIFILSGREPKLKDQKGSWILSRGNAIIYNLQTQQMKVDQPVAGLQSETSRDLLHVGNPPAEDSLFTKPYTSIQSKILDFDYDKHMATFEGDVQAADPQLRITCSRMVFYFDAQNEVTRVEAFENVRMYNEGKEASGDKAVFNRQNNTVVLTGVKPKLKDPKGSTIISRGDGIFYNCTTKKMQVHMPQIEIPGGTEKSLNSPPPTN